MKPPKRSEKEKQCECDTPYGWSCPWGRPCECETCKRIAKEKIDYWDNLLRRADSPHSEEGKQ